MNDNKIEIERSESAKQKPTAGEILQKTLRISLIVLIVIFALVMVLNLVMSGISAITGRPPSLFGITPCFMPDASMAGEKEDSIEYGSLVWFVKTDYSELAPGDVVAYYDNGGILIGRILFDTKTDGYLVRADNAPGPFSTTLNAHNLIGRRGAELGGIGLLAFFVDTTPGKIVLIGFPAVVFIALGSYEAYLMVKARKEKAEAEAKENESNTEN